MTSHLYGLKPSFPQKQPVLQTQTAPLENFLPFKKQEKNFMRNMSRRSTKCKILIKTHQIKYCKDTLQKVFAQKSTSKPV